MKKLNVKITFITNLILIFTIALVFGVSFIPEQSLPIYSGINIQPIYRGNAQKKNVSLMFNVYENTKTVNEIIDVLNEKGVKATFFVGGCWADDNEKTLVRIVSEGHEIANHGYFHKDHKKLSYDKNKQEIELTGKIINGLCGVMPNLFAPPSGSFSDVTLSVADELGYKVIMWSKDTIDWRDDDLSLIFKRATKNLTNGDLVLMHPKPHTKNVLGDIIDYYKENGFSVVTVSQNISD